MAHPPGDDGLVRISTDYPDIIPFLTYATDASAREQLWRVFRLRGDPANVDVLRRMLERRHELATLLGYPSWAQYAAENKMVGSEQSVADFIERIADAAKDRAARTDLPVWHPDVECYDVNGLDGRLLGRIVLDMHPRADKYNHAAMFPLTTGKSGLRVPECALVCNLPRPSPGGAGPDRPAPQASPGPALLQHSDVETFFHEFGHLIHHIFAGDSRWSGTKESSGVTCG